VGAHLAYVTFSIWKSADRRHQQRIRIAEVTEVVNERGHTHLARQTARRLAALQLLARVLGMAINKKELTGPGSKLVETDHNVDHSARIRSHLDEIARRLPASAEQPLTMDVTPQRASPSALLAARLRYSGSAIEAPASGARTGRTKTRSLRKRCLLLWERLHIPVCMKLVDGDTKACVRLSDVLWRKMECGPDHDQNSDPDGW
jgi:hypothetical protein